MSAIIRNKVRKAAVAGFFYPLQPETLTDTVERLLNSQTRVMNENTKILIVPHAGYPYSGSTAAAGYCTIQSLDHSITRIALLGPSHHKYLNTIVYPVEEIFSTPLGSISVNQNVISELAARHNILKPDSSAHVNEHCIEVQLPFLQNILPDFSIIPLLVGEVDSNFTAELISDILEYDDTLVIISTDLSHYLSYHECVLRDNETASMIESGVIDSSQKNIACGLHALTGAILYGRNHHMSIR